MTIVLRKRRGALPEGAQTPHMRWLQRGLKSAYLLIPGAWQINLVTGKVGGNLQGVTTPTFAHNKLRTPNTNNVGYTLAHGLTTSIALPVSIVIGAKRISASGVGWSLLSNANVWSGWYGSGNSVSQSVNADFAGSAGLASGLGPVAFRATGTDLVVYTQGGGRSVDAAVSNPGGYVNVGTVALGWARGVVSDNPSQTDFTHFYAFQGALSDSELQELANEPGRLFADRRIWVPVSAGGSLTLTTSLSVAIQQAQALTASLSTAVQTTSATTTGADVAVQAAATAQASLDAAVQTAASAVASLQTAVQDSGLQTASIDAALQLARSATVALDLAVQAHLSATASVNLQVQAAASATASVNMQIQAGSSASVSLSTAILQSALSAVGLDLAVLRVGSQTAGVSAALQAARSAAAAIDIAIQALRSAGASVNLQIQDGVSALASIDVAVQQARNAVTGVQLAIGQSSMVSASLDAVLMLQRAVSAALGGAVSAARIASAGLSFYIDDGGAVVITGPIRLLAMISQEIAFEATIEQV